MLVQNGVAFSLVELELDLDGIQYFLEDSRKASFCSEHVVSQEED